MAEKNEMHRLEDRIETVQSEKTLMAEELAGKHKQALTSMNSLHALELELQKLTVENASDKEKIQEQLTIRGAQEEKHGKRIDELMLE